MIKDIESKALDFLKCLEKKKIYSFKSLYNEYKDDQGFISLASFFESHPDLWNIAVYIEANEDFTLVPYNDPFREKSNFVNYIPELSLSVRENEIVSKTAKKISKLKDASIGDDILYYDKKEYLSVYVDKDITSDRLAKIISKRPVSHDIYSLSDKKKKLISANSKGLEYFNYRKIKFRRKNLSDYQLALERCSNTVKNFMDDISYKYTLKEVSPGEYVIYNKYTDHAVLIIWPTDFCEIKKTEFFNDSDMELLSTTKEFIKKYQLKF